MRPQRIEQAAFGKWARPMAVALAAALLGPGAVSHGQGVDEQRGGSSPAGTPVVRVAVPGAVAGAVPTVVRNRVVGSPSSLAVARYYADPPQSVGVVRAFRDPLDDGYRTRFLRYRPTGRFNRWPARGLSLGRLDPFPELSVGIVRAYRDFGIDVRPVRPGVLVFTNPRASAEGADRASPERAAASHPGETSGATVSAYAAHTMEGLSKAQRSDPWALLDAGYYRNARELFEDQPETAAVRTGLALCAALSGDFAAAQRLMPDDPALPEAVTLSEATRQRIHQTAQTFFTDNPEMQTALAKLI